VEEVIQAVPRLRRGTAWITYLNPNHHN